MSRTQSINYTDVGAAGTSFSYTDSSNDPYQRAELQKLGKAVDLHDHAAGRGLAVARIAAGAIGISQLADDSVTKAKMASAAVGMDEIDWPSIASCLVYSNVNLALTNNTETLVLFNAERQDLLSMHSLVTNTGRINILTTGMYNVGAQVSFASNATGRREAFIRVNGATYIASEQKLANSGDRTSFAFGRPYPLTAGDYLELTAFQTSGGSLNLEVIGNRGIEFWAVRVGG